MFLRLCTLLLLLVISGCADEKKEKIAAIFDSDISSDVDDVGAVAVLHALADNQEVDILAMMVSSGDSWSGPCLRALNGWFGRPDIPVGVIQGKSVSHLSKYTKKIADEFKPNGSAASTPVDAVRLYRQILSSQQDEGVIIITVGYLTNLQNLLQSQPDTISSLDGMALVRKKVKRVVCMGGEFPAGREWNFYQDAAATKAVVQNWPTPIVFCGFEIGKDVMTGAGLQKKRKTQPVRRSYELYNGLANRPSWDQLTVLYALRWADSQDDAGLFKLQYGEIRIADDGGNSWTDGSKRARSYVKRNASAAVIAGEIEKMMLSH